jgi:hypothetical protein
MYPGKKSILMRVTRLRASPRHGSSGRFLGFNQFACSVIQSAAGFPRRGRRVSSQIIMRNKTSHDSHLFNVTSGEILKKVLLDAPGLS